MKTTPMLFNGDMIRALIDGRKTQTRRPINLKTGDTFDERALKDAIQEWRPVYDDLSGKRVGRKAALVRCPYGQPGDLIWVRETFADLRGTGIEGTDPARRFDAAYSADVKPGSASDEARIDFRIKWKPSIHMPRWASRLTLRITDVRVERVQDISDEDAAAEGVEPFGDGSAFVQLKDAQIYSTTRGCFASLWRSIYTKSGYTWGENPWVWAITFDVIHANVDDVRAIAEAVPA